MSYPSAALDVIVAEAYLFDKCIYFQNKTNGYQTLFNEKVSRAVIDVWSFDDFVDAIVSEVTGRHVIIAIGDSRTGCVINWPWHFMRQPEYDLINTVMINLGGWSKFLEDRVPVLDFLLPRLTQAAASSVTCVVFGLWGDMWNKQWWYNDFMSGIRHTPFSSIEESILPNHIYGKQFVSLVSSVPTEWDGAARWIARRVLAVFNVLGMISVENGARFIAVLEPNSYPEYAPSYEIALKRRYDELPDNLGLSYEQWYKGQGYASGPQDVGLEYREWYPIANVYENILELWPKQVKPGDNSYFLDLSRAFSQEQDNCFVEFDGHHFNEKGSIIIAKLMLEFFQTISV